MYNKICVNSVPMENNKSSIVHYYLRGFSCFLYYYLRGFFCLRFSFFFLFKNAPTHLCLSKDKIKGQFGKNTTLTPTKTLSKK